MSASGRRTKLPLDGGRSNVDHAQGIHVMRIFFYGLFMDESLLSTKGITPTNKVIGYVEGFELRIGERATLFRQPGGRTYGVVMDILPSDARDLYSEDSVADYLPEPVTVETLDGSRLDATCYNLPPDKVTGTNKEYAESLIEVATKLKLPDSYLDQIAQAVG